MKYALLSAKEIFAAWIRFRNMRLKRIVEMWMTKTKASRLIRKCCLL
jgi:hypothetical protein